MAAPNTHVPTCSSLVATESFGTYPGELNIKPNYFLHAVTSELVLTAATMSVPSEHHLYGPTRNISRKAYKVFSLVPRPRPAFRRLKYGKAVEDLVYFIM